MGADKKKKKYIGKYEIIEEIGKGGMGVVYKSVDPYIERTLAIKTIRFDIPKDEADHKKWKKRFLREAKLAGNLAHPNIVTIYDAGEDSGLFYIAMEYIEGQSLREVLRSSKKMSFEDIQTLMEQVCDALSYASKKGVIHCDIKPENIIIDNEGKVYLVDFGIARTSAADLTKTMLSMVTPSYTSPERLNGFDPDIRSDIFALGAVLYEIVSGEKAFQGETVSTIMKSILYDAPTEMKTIPSDVPKEIHYILQKALAKEPEDRYQNYEEFAHDLKNYKDLKPDESFEADYNPDDMTVLLTRKKKFPAILSVSISILALVILAGFIWMYVSKGTSKNATRYISKEQKFIEERNYDKAIDNLKKIVESDPNDFNAYYLLGLAYQKKSLFNKSIPRYEKAININKSFAPPYRGLAEVYEQNGDIDEAILYYEKYVQLFPKEDDISEIQKKLASLKEGGTTQIETEEETEPVITAETVVSEKKGTVENGVKEQAEVAYKKGKKSFDEQNYEQALSYFNEALKLDPTNEDAQRYFRLASHEKKKREDIALNRSLGIKSYNDKNYTQAAVHFNEIINLDPENRDAKEYITRINQAILEEKINNITKPAEIKERPFYKKTVSELSLDKNQVAEFEGIYLKNVQALGKKLSASTDDKQKSQALTSFSIQIYSELRPILNEDQSKTLNNILSANGIGIEKVVGTGKTAAKSDPKVAGTTNEKPADGSNTNTGEATESIKDSGSSEEKEGLAQSISLGVKAYNEKNFDQATMYFNEVLKLDPNNAEAKKYLEYIKLEKIKMMSDETEGEADTENKDKTEAELPEGM